MNRTCIIAATAALTLTAAGLLFAGPLNPPAGPVTSTYKTLQEVEPRTAINVTNTPGDADSLFKITQPGSYYLTGNITGVAARHGIEIDTSNVTLDLMGFRILGTGGSLDGIFVNGSESNLTIRNGSVRSFGGDGLDAGSAESVRVIDFTARNCDGRGVVLGAGSTATNVIADSNLLDGIVAGNGSALDHCVARSNGGNGISSLGGSTITGCTAYQNTGIGISAGNGCTITGCTASFNTGDGIFASQGSTVSGCTAQSNAGDGITASNGSTVSGCTAQFNSGDGISAAAGCTVVGCTAQFNSGDGIEINLHCRVTDNTCVFNGNGGNGAGIHATGSDNRIEGNNCTGNDRGIDVGFAGNIIIKNTCSGNTINWTIAANNVVGPILDRRAPASAAISGNSAPSSLGTTDPSANFTY